MVCIVERVGLTSWLALSVQGRIVGIWVVWYEMLRKVGKMSLNATAYFQKNSQIRHIVGLLSKMQTLVSSGGQTK